MKELIKENVILTEGKDTELFIMHTCTYLKKEEIQVMDIGGISEFSNKLLTIKKLTNFNRVKKMILVRDAENSYENAEKSLKESLKKSGFSIPKGPFSFAQGAPDIAFIILCENMKSTATRGALEDICLATVKEDPIFSCVEGYLKCVESKNQIKKPHKLMLHAYLAGKNDFVGLKIGEATRANAWDWNHTALKPLVDFIKSI